MKAEKVSLLADRLFAEFIAPFVVGGPVGPTRFFSGKSALDIHEREPHPEETYVRFQDARLTVARSLLPLDRVPPLSGSDWALLAGLGDLTLALHPTFRTGLRDRIQRRVLPVVLATVSKIPYVATLGEFVARHTLLARLNDLARTDTKVDWWTGSKLFEGVAPSKRLLAWPEARRVRVNRINIPFFQLVRQRSLRDVGKPISHRAALEEVLLRSPLTRLLSAGHTDGFAWHPELLFWLDRKEARKLILRGFRSDDQAPKHVAALLEAAATTPPEVRARVSDFAVEWATETLLFKKQDPFAVLDDEKRTLFRAVEPAAKKTVAAWKAARAGRKSAA